MVLDTKTIALFGFQQEDIEHLSGQANVLIGNEPGTGKTYEAIARDQQIRAKITDGRMATTTLVIAPLTTLEDVWLTHLRELTNLKCIVVDPKDRSRSWETFKKSRADVFIVHWEALRNMPELAQASWAHVIADEAHKAKNRKAQQTKGLKSIKKVRYKTALTGTPVINRPDEFWSILNWLWPDRYRSYWKFLKKYVETVTEHGAHGRVYQKVVGPKNEKALQAEIAPFFVRRLKVDVLPDLPDKYYTTVHVDLDPKQRRVYEQMRKDMIAWIGDQEEELLAAPMVVAQLTRLQQFSCAYAELREDGRVRLSEPSSKIDALMNILEEGDEQVVVFSRFKSLIALVAQRLRDKKIGYVALTGDTPQENRAGLVQRFQSGRSRVFIGTIQAGGVGITLHAASRIVFLDRDWSPALNLQAEDRLHRIGQKSAVQVIDIMAKNTVDLGKFQKLELKKRWIAQILGDPYTETEVK